jgi:hypothetical protein
VADGTFALPGVVKKSADFVCVHGTQKYANHFKIKEVPTVLFTDADGDEIHRATFFDQGALEGAMKTALDKYQNKPVAWKSEVGPTSKKLLVVGFDDEAGEALKALDDKSIVKLHARCEFVKLPAQKESEAAKKWGATTFPTIILGDPTQENPEKNPLDRLTGRKSTLALKAAIQKALARLESKK